MEGAVEVRSGGAAARRIALLVVAVVPIVVVPWRPPSRQMTSDTTRNALSMWGCIEHSRVHKTGTELAAGAERASLDASSSPR